MTKNVSALARYGAMTRPNASSFSLSMAPIRTGTMEISFLMVGLGCFRKFMSAYRGRTEQRTLRISYGRRGGASQYCVQPRRCLTPSPRTSLSSLAPLWLQDTRKIRGETKRKKHTRAIEGQATKG